MLGKSVNLMLDNCGMAYGVNSLTGVGILTDFNETKEGLIMV